MLPQAPSPIFSGLLLFWYPPLIPCTVPSFRHHPVIPAPTRHSALSRHSGESRNPGFDFPILESTTPPFPPTVIPAKAGIQHLILNVGWALPTTNVHHNFSTSFSFSLASCCFFLSILLIFCNFH